MDVFEFPSKNSQQQITRSRACILSFLTTLNEGFNLS
jgi:hypothetical protein